MRNYGRGWNQIVKDLEADLKRMAPGIESTGIKEGKFGDFLYYYDLNSVPPEKSEAVARRVNRAAEVALETCIECGELGRIRYVSAPQIEAHVYCDTHTPKDWKTL